MTPKHLLERPRGIVSRWLIAVGGIGAACADTVFLMLPPDTVMPRSSDRWQTAYENTLSLSPIALLIAIIGVPAGIAFAAGLLTRGIRYPSPRDPKTGLAGVATLVGWGVMGLASLLVIPMHLLAGWGLQASARGGGYPAYEGLRLLYEPLFTAVIFTFIMGSVLHAFAMPNPGWMRIGLFFVGTVGLVGMLITFQRNDFGGYLLGFAAGVAEGLYAAMALVEIGVMKRRQHRELVAAGILSRVR